MPHDSPQDGGKIRDEFAAFHDGELSAEGIVVPQQLLPEASSVLMLALGLTGLRSRRQR